MNTKNIILIVLVLLIVGIGIYFFMNKSGTSAMPETASGPTSLTALMALGIPQKCDFSDTTNPEAQTSGTVYVSGGKSRGDFTSTAGGQTFHAHSIVESDTMYSWVEENGMGVKIAINKDQQKPTGDSKQFDAGKAMDYHCSAWVPDSSKFDVPTNIKFMEMAAPSMPSAGSGASAGASASGGAKTNACSACDSVPEAYRAQCKVAAHC